MVNCKAITYRIRLTTTKYTFIENFPFRPISIGISTLKKKKGLHQRHHLEPSMH